MSEKKPTRRKNGALGKVLALPFYLAGAWIAYSRLFVDHDLALPDAIPAPRKTLLSEEAGLLSYYTDQQASGRPLVLIHSVNAAANAYEMAPLFAHYRKLRPVFALDLPGYGFSERSSRDYTPELFAQAISDFLSAEVQEPADIVALSLGCEFVARASLDQPDLFNSLVFISPSGFNSYGTGRASQKAGMRGGADRVHAVLSFPWWGRPLFDLIASRRSIDFFLRQSFTGQVDQTLADYGYASSHQLGAEHAPLHFLSGRLFTPNAGEILYEALSVPSLIIYDQDAYVSFDGLPTLLQRNPNVQSARIAPTRGLPHWEKLEETVLALNSFWADVAEGQA